MKEIDTIADAAPVPQLTPEANHSMQPPTPDPDEDNIKSIETQSN